MNIYLNMINVSITTHFRSSSQYNPSHSSIRTLFQYYRSLLHVDTDLNCKKDGLLN